MQFEHGEDLGINNLEFIEIPAQGSAAIDPEASIGKMGEVDIVALISMGDPEAREENCNDDLLILRGKDGVLDFGNEYPFRVDTSDPSLTHFIASPGLFLPNTDVRRGHGVKALRVGEEVGPIGRMSYIREGNDELEDRLGPFTSYTSRRHASIENRGAAILIHDLGSLNGTRVHGSPVKAYSAETAVHQHIGTTDYSFEDKSREPRHQRAELYPFRGSYETGMDEYKGEDALIARPDLGLFGVIDGVGGGRSRGKGEYAAKTLAQALQRQIDLGQNLVQACKSAQHVLNETNRFRPEMVGGAAVGTFIRFISEKRIEYVHVGDTRLYAYNKYTEKVRQLTEDEGEGRYVTNTFHTDGQRVNIVETGTIDLNEGDRLFLMSDGIHGDYENQSIHPKIFKFTLSQQNLAEAVELLISASKKQDDKSIVALEI